MVAMRWRVWVRTGGLPATGCGQAGASLALVHVLQPAKLLQQFGSGVVVIPNGAWAQGLLQYQAVRPQEGIVGSLLAQGRRTLEV